MEETITEKKQEIGINCDIDLQNIYNAIVHLEPKHQGTILKNYKLTELYSIFRDDQEYQKYLENLMSISTTYTNMVSAIIALHKEAVLDHLGKGKFDIFEAMNKAYDSMSEEEKKKFTKDMLNKEEFFKDTYETMMSVFHEAIKTDRKEETKSNE